MTLFPRLPRYTGCIMGLLAVSLTAAAETPTAAAEPATVATEIRQVQIENPSRSTGLQLGDRLERRLQVELQVPYQLAVSALPAKGSNREGIELSEVQLEKQAAGEFTRYNVLLRYQVMTAPVKPAILQLPAEKLALNGGPQALAIEIPAWRFWFAPLANADLPLAKAALLPQAPPSPIALSAHYQGLMAALACVALGLAGMIYVHADRRWLPFMGGPFAQAYRQIRRLPKTTASEPQALQQLHQAFDRIHGASVFAADIDTFIAQHPQFAGARDDIAQFFAQSNQRLFAGKTASHGLHDQLLNLARRLRHAERGLA